MVGIGASSGHLRVTGQLGVRRQDEVGNGEESRRSHSGEVLL